MEAKSVTMLKAMVSRYVHAPGTCKTCDQGRYNDLLDLKKAFSERIGDVADKLSEKLRAPERGAAYTPDEGNKFDDGKLRYDLVSPKAHEAMVEVITYGAKKYAPRNWEKGVRFGRLYAAVTRHLEAWWTLQDIDPESSLQALAHAACNIHFLLHFMLHYARYERFDDRPKE